MRRRNVMLLACLGLGISFAAAPVTINGLSLEQAEAAAASKKPKSKSSVAKRKATTKKATKKAASKKSTKSAAVKTGRAAVVALSPRDMIDSEQLAPGLVDSAATKTPVELLTDYKTSLQEGDLETAAAVLRLAVGHSPDQATMLTANELVGVTLDATDTEVVLTLGGSEKAKAVEAIAGRSSGSADTDSGSRIGSAHAAIAHGPQMSPLACLTSYRIAVRHRDPESAAFSLNCATGGKVDETAVERTNALLNITADRLPVAGLAALASGTSLPLR
jgi:hypothetical protein